MILAPAGTCWTLRSSSRTPEPILAPAIRTTGNGCMSCGRGVTTLITEVTGGPGPSTMASGETAEDETAGGETVNVTGPLLPAGFPSELACVATAVYCPAVRAGLASPDVQPGLVPAAIAVETTVPLGVGPAWIWTLTGVTSLAVPVNDGVMSLTGDSSELSV